jgi:poly(A) polymerase
MTTAATIDFTADDRPLVSAAQSLAQRLRDAGGHTALFAGGCVRDWLLGRTPKDIDIATSAAPAQIRRLFPQARAVGEAFGVMLVRRGGVDFEIATFRSDGDYADGRHPDSVVLHSSPEADAARRDFTINALFADPATGEIRDHVGGIDDLRAGRLRAVGDPRRRFTEDHLRLLRAVRFAARLGFDIDPDTWAAMRESAPRLAGIAPERVKMELDAILTGPAADRALRLLRDAGLLAVILPEVAALDGVEQGREHHPEGDVFTHVALMLKLAREDAEALRTTDDPPPGAHPLTPTLAWGILLHDIGKPPTAARKPDGTPIFHGHDVVGARMAEEITRRLRFSNAEREQVVALVASHMKFMHVQQMRQSTLKRFLRTPGFAEHLALHRADCRGSHGRLDNLGFCVAKLASFDSPEETALRPPPLLTGKDLKSLGYAPGPLFREILEAVEDAQLEDRLASREAAIGFVREGWPPDADA